MKEQITGKQLAYLLLVFLMGGGATVGLRNADRDSWIAYALLMLLSAPVLYMYHRLAVLRAEYAADARGKTFERLSAAAAGVYGLAAVGMNALMLDFFCDFLSSTALTHTSRLMPVVFMSVTVFILAVCRSDAAARICTVIFVLTLLFAVLALAAALPQLDFGAVLPVFENGVAGMTDALFTAAAMQLGFAFFPVTALAPALKGKWGGYAVCGGAAACLIMTVHSARDIMLLGYPLISLYRFPAYTAMEVVHVSELTQRLEMLTAIVYVMCQPVKAALCLRLLTNAAEKRRQGGRYAAAAAAVALAAGITMLIKNVDGYRIMRAARMPAIILLIALPAAYWAALELRRLLRKNKKTSPPFE
ncbi:MAG: GerAB/ArcD/ProY family transporter [Clostridia bacterium]|nr:GerAB/ArcD/ProY family transporter [Clostridia bacterium]